VPPWALAALGVAVAVGAILRLRRLGVPSLWADELVSWWAASGDTLGQVISRTNECMATPPLSFLVQHVSVGLAGPGEWSLRLPSALAGIATIVVVFLAGRRLFGPAAASVSALLLAIHPVHLWFSTDGRPYSLAILLAAGSTWALSELVRSGRWAPAVAYAVLTAAMLHAQFIFVPFVLAQALALALAGRMGARAMRPGRVAAAVGGAVLLALPLAPQILGVAGRASSLTWGFRGETPPGVFAYFQTTPLVVAALAAGAVWLMARPGEAARGERESGATLEGQSRFDLLALILGFLVPSLLLWGAARALDLSTLLKPRYLSVSLVPCVLLLGWLVARPPWPAGRFTLGGSFLLLIVVTGVVGPLRRGETFNANAGQEDWRTVATILQQEMQPGDVLLLRSGLVETTELFAGSYPESCKPYLAAPLGAGLYLEPALDPVLLPNDFNPGSYPEAYRERVARRLQGRSRIWFVMLNPPNPPAYYQQVARYLEETTRRPFRLGRTGNFEYLGQVTLALFEAGG
jgi:uncharacterized membrane protein